MFRKLALLALVTPLVSALTLHIPDNMRTSQSVTVTWDTAPGDPETFTLELTNEEFHDQFALVNNIDPNQGSVTFTVPVVPVRGGYTLEAVNVGNIGDVYSKTGQFSVGETFITGSSSSSSTTRTGTSTTGSTSTTGTGTTSRSTASNTTPPSTSTTTTSQSTVTSPNPAATNLGNGVSSLKLNAGAVLAGVAGAVAFAL
ncbi:hypothetical protein D9611_005284 [Ephemerocybe angulata]|uniref:Yeast cell wall synthesis Kre9/Knh1-like N-terminal domain-containing protein n=1 Tax=Ephemerocybe angulata TaxID=980116 RepID=A0A8H5C011_9AGAR|nr:hypothetical protein D9611_005284 [Tulosesus angulatus]